MTAVVPQGAPAPDRRRRATRPAVTCLQIRVGQDAAPLLEFILAEAGFEWRDLVRHDVDATVVIETRREQLDDTIRALRQRLGGNLSEVSRPPQP